MNSDQDRQSVLDRLEVLGSTLKEEFKLGRQPKWEVSRKGTIEFIIGSTLSFSNKNDLAAKVVTDYLNDGDDYVSFSDESVVAEIKERVTIETSKAKIRRIREERSAEQKARRTLERYHLVRRKLKVSAIFWGAILGKKQRGEEP